LPAIVCLVTEADVEAAVANAERLWENALAAREKVDLLSSEAEELAEASAATSEEAASQVDASATFKLSMLGDAKAATDASLNANAVLADAVAAAEEAERLEALAEAATDAMDAAIAQHLEDFPESDLGDDVDEDTLA